VHIADDQQRTSPDRLRAMLDKIGYPAVPLQDAGHLAQVRRPADPG
jgi:hypothetical protein